jgi:3-hydroxymyristoyl/3-hydroxydecanoyl-(acyl carrier protein) dehydratase
VIPFPRSLRPLPCAHGAFAFEVEAEHPAFSGHFPEQPILPGVVQLDWAIRLGGETFGALGAFQSVEHLKFQAIIGPLEPMELKLAWDNETRQLDFAYAGPKGRASSGLVQFSTGS